MYSIKGFLAQPHYLFQFAGTVFREENERSMEEEGIRRKEKKKKGRNAPGYCPSWRVDAKEKRRVTNKIAYFDI